VLMSKADAGLLVVRAGKTRYSVVDKLLEQMPREKVLGVVLNRTQEQPDESPYYYQHRYYNRERRATEIQPGERLEEEVATVN
jgi:Mrp family chromosome partitioning ATPase